jgi:5-methylcytosine-specific restriction endonuclease McrA
VALWCNGSGSTNRYSPEEIFQKDRLIGHGTLKAYAKKYVKYQCGLCGIIDEYNSRPITLQLDHIDGDRTNNLLENLRFLCPNCHSQTDTFCRTKIKSNRDVA